MDYSSKIYIAGHRGMVGSAIVRKLTKDGYTNIVVRTSSELDLRDQQAVAQFFATEKPDYVFLAAAKVGGIMANVTYPAEFLYDNLQIQNNIIHQSYVCGVKKLLFLGSSCIYPRDCPQPMKEEYLLTGPLESTNEPYAIAKIAGIKLCQSYNRQYGTNFIAVMPTNLYGPNDNYDLETSHVLPALIRKFHDAVQSGAPTVEVWGSGAPRREFLHVDDMADASVFLINTFSPTKEQNEAGEVFFNVGTGTDITIKELATLLQEVSGFQGEIVWNVDRPDGTPEKLLDMSRLHGLGWKHDISLREGVAEVYGAYTSSLVDK
jgi:GDP-L-fucose synthase